MIRSAIRLPHKLKNLHFGKTRQLLRFAFLARPTSNKIRYILALRFVPLAFLEARQSETVLSEMRNKNQKDYSLARLAKPHQW